MPDQGYVDQLATELCTRHTALVATLETDLSTHRRRLAIVVRFIHNPAIAHDIRAGLARDLQLPEPTQ
jgi:diphthamide biosynthesis methyltransferase